MRSDRKISVNGIHNDPFIKGMLKRLPAEQRDSFSDEQLLGLKVALGARTWGVHPIDLRWTIRFWKKSYYFVFISGANRRPASRRYQELARLGKSIMLATVIIVSSLLGLLLLYIIKSALGIDLVDNFSLGIWSKIKDLFSGGLF
ncbi:MAG TPA: 3-phosphoshikimate 1-carboxyvinyltransferase [Gammaproteobacteria bacterium]|nr:3-phosphoshikimate 1-carboxyvinyltransferase [Gammaproteobacteria bacterium]